MASKRKFKTGQKVRVTDWGVEKTAVVDFQNRPGGIVWVIMDATNRRRWFFADSLRKVRPCR